MTADLRREEIARTLAAKHVEHVHSGGCHRHLDYGPATVSGDLKDAVLVDQEGPAGYCDASGCHQDWPCDTVLALRSQDTATARIAELEGAISNYIVTVTRAAHRPDHPNFQSAEQVEARYRELLEALQARAVLSGETRTDGATVR